MGSPLICPPQNLAPHEEESRLFNRPWYLFFNNLARTLETLNQLQNLTANCSGLLMCSTSYSDVQGASVTLTLTGTYLIIASFQVGLDVDANQVFGRLVVNGVAQTGEVEVTLVTGAGTGSMAVSASRQWIYSNSGSNTAKLQGKKTGATGTAQVKDTNTTITAVFLG